jgi:hypothetical protein
MNICIDVFHFVQDSPCTREHKVTFVSEGAGGTVDEYGAKCRLETPDVGRYIRLDRIEVLGSSRERPMVGDGDEALKLLDFHG